MIRVKGRRLIPSVVGIFLIIVGALLCPFGRMTKDDMYVAFKKLVLIPLQQPRAAASSVVTFEIPNTKGWQRIRDTWKEPRYVIAIDSGPDRTNSDHV